MPSRDDEEAPRRRRKDPDRERDRDSTSSRDKPRSDKHRTHKSSSSTKLPLRHRSTSRERDRDSPRSSHSGRGTKKTSGMASELKRRSGEDLKPRTSYPSFSKAHSREAVGSREEMSARITDVYTPEPTELEPEKERRRSGTPRGKDVPPSPPLTAEEPEIRRSGSGGSMRKSAEDVRSEPRKEKKSSEDSPRRKVRVKSHKSVSSLRKDRFQESEISSMPGAFPEELDEQKSTPASSYRRTVSSGSRPASNISQTTTTDSDATSVARDRKGYRRPPNISTAHEHSPPSVTDSQPRTPTNEQTYATYPPQPTKTPIIEVGGPSLDSPQSFGMTPLTAIPPPPPPPPPPMTAPQDIPRVDYLLKNGGLQTMVPRRLVHNGPTLQQYAMYQSPQVMQQAPMEEYSKIFTPIHKRLDDYMHVLRNHGSLAVATGYKSVARRLLDKLSTVFARDISSQRCDCVICGTVPQPKLSDEEDSGVSWGEILEYTAGRQELPQWPPFTIEPGDGGLGISGATQAPMQKLDIDVPDEYREHYIRQNQKTKRAVQSWLAQQPELPSSPPDEADEDTLMFAMMTKLDQQQRNFFIALMHGQSKVSISRAPTPAERPATPSTALKRARMALQRLYRLERAPRDCECAMYLLHNPHLHGMLATLAEVNEQEWDILVSGRFDGFLWSGAEAPFPPSASQAGSRLPSRGPTATPVSRNATPFSGLSALSNSRGTTPFSPIRGPTSSNLFPSRGPTPAPGGTGLTPPAPVQLDEDTELAVLAEVERNLFTDMERFEDAFEVLHSRAELVRQMMRERAAGLAMQAQMRRGSLGGPGDAFVRLDTPASGITDIEESEDDDGLGDTASLAPDDSASQISSSRRHRRHGRGEKRRTPAPQPVLVEEDEGIDEKDDGRRYVAGLSGRRSKY